MPMAIYSGDLNNAKLILNESLRLKLGNQSPYLKYSDLKNQISFNTAVRIRDEYLDKREKGEIN